MLPLDIASIVFSLPESKGGCAKGALLLGSSRTQFPADAAEEEVQTVKRSVLSEASFISSWGLSGGSDTLHPEHSSACQLCVKGTHGQRRTAALGASKRRWGEPVGRWPYSLVMMPPQWVSLLFKCKLVNSEQLFLSCISVLAAVLTQVALWPLCSPCVHLIKGCHLHVPFLLKERSRHFWSALLLTYLNAYSKMRQII